MIIDRVQIFFNVFYTVGGEDADANCSGVVAACNTEIPFGYILLSMGVVVVDTDTD